VTPEWEEKYEKKLYTLYWRVDGEERSVTGNRAAVRDLMRSLTSKEKLRLVHGASPTGVMIPTAECFEYDGWKPEQIEEFPKVPKVG
jgi:hypothetical protein